MSTRLDPVTLEILWSRLINISEECWTAVLRTAFSLVIGEALDFACEVLDEDANSLAHSPRSMPVFNLTLPWAVKHVLRAIPKSEIREGDVLITNDPWQCAGHLNDLAIVTPVFRGGRIVALVGSVAHASDIGGTRNPAQAREVYEEGLMIPPMRLYDRGRLNRDLATLIHANVRRPDMVMGDIQAQVSANHVGAQRLLKFMDEYQLETLVPLATEIQSRAERAMRDAIAAIPDGTYRSAVTIDALGDPLTIPCAITVHGDELTVDYEGAPEQLPIGGINCTYTYTAAHTTYALKCILTPEIPANAGDHRPLHVKAPEGSLMNARYPASVSIRTMTGWYCAPAVFRALAPVLPAKVQAFTGLPMSIAAYGRDAQHQFFNDNLFQGGGQGASAHGDGKSALLYPTSAANVSVEMFELRTPILVACKELIPDSGGQGKQRGGLGQRVRIKKLYDDGLPVLVDVRPTGMLTPQSGLFGGAPGRSAGATLTDGDRVLRDAEVGTLAILTRADQEAEIQIAGGSGYGDPRERGPDAIARDVDEGYVSASS